jgi:pimeloyl-ACP methyl ester carboxylesterase
MAVDIEYARHGELSLAYTVLGDGPVDLVFGAGLMSHLDLLWGDPHAFSWFQRLAAACRVILFDKPGTGLSDPVVGQPTLEQRASDFLAVMDAAGARRAVVVGLSEAGPPAALLAATHPDRVEALVLLSTYARTTAAPDYLPDLDRHFEEEMWPPTWRAADHWGDGEFLRWLSPWFRRNPVYSRLAPSVERACASPSMARAIIHSLFTYDVRAALGAISAPTLVAGRSDEVIPARCGLDLAERIAGARAEIVPGDEHLCFLGGDDLADVILRFLDAPMTSSWRSDRALLTLVYTDIVGSTAAAALLGDQRWRSVLARHDEITLEEAGKHGGRLVKTLGDGALMVFDRPAQAVRCAVAVRERVADLGVDLRASVHTGECEIVGEDIAGLAAHIGSRLLAHADGGEIVVSGTVRDLTFGAGLDLEPRGSVELRDLPGRWDVLAVAASRRADLQPAPMTRGRATRESAAVDTMTAVDRSVVALTRRAPRLTRAALRVVSSRRRTPQA